MPSITIYPPCVTRRQGPFLPAVLGISSGARCQSQKTELITLSALPAPWGGTCKRCARRGLVCVIVEMGSGGVQRGLMCVCGAPVLKWESSGRWVYDHFLSTPIMKVLLSPRDRLSAQDSSFLLPSPARSLYGIFLQLEGESPSPLLEMTNPLPYQLDKVHLQPCTEP